MQTYMALNIRCFLGEWGSKQTRWLIALYVSAVSPDGCIFVERTDLEHRYYLNIKMRRDQRARPKLYLLHRRLLSLAECWTCCRVYMISFITTLKCI